MMNWPNMNEGSSAGGYEQWEYHTRFVEANATAQNDYLSQKYPGQKMPKFAVEAVLPELNQFGEQGWELIYMEPLNVGNHGDVGIGNSSVTVWTHTYFCVFKRRKRS